MEVTVESLGGLGDGISTYQGKPLFIPKSCAGDRLSVHITSANQQHAYGTIAEILQPGPHRRPAPCEHYDACGGCALQHLDEAYYRDFKTRMLRTSLSLAGFAMPDAEVIFLPAISRRRVEFKLCRDNGKPMLAFYAPRSHQPVGIESCMVLTPALAALIAPLNACLPAMPFAHGLRSLNLTQADSAIDMTLIFDAAYAHALPQWQNIAEELGVARISLYSPEGLAATVKRSPVTMQLGEYQVPLLPMAFLQATAAGQAILTTIAMQAAKKSIRVIDLFAGMGTYSFPLSAQAKTLAVEGDKAMAALMQKTIKEQKIAMLSATQRDLFKNPLMAHELVGFDTAILNPPRAGAKAQTQQLAASCISNVVMISCNPATFARDAKLLKEGGFRLASALGIDQFIWNQHLEIAAVFTR